MKLKSIFLICCLILTSASLVMAEYYQYVDKDGTKHFTDDLSQVPKNQRPNLKTYQTIQPPPENESSDTKVQGSDNALTIEALMAENDTLKKEYDALNKKKETLSEQKKTLSGKEYNTQITGLNLEIKHYQKRREDYNDRVKEFNMQSLSSETNESLTDKLPAKEE